MRVRPRKGRARKWRAVSLALALLGALSATAAISAVVLASSGSRVSTQATRLERGEGGEATIPAVTPAGTVQTGPLAAMLAAGGLPLAPGRSNRAAKSAAHGAFARMVGQMIVTRFAGTHPSRTLLTRIRRGEVGGVILFAENIDGARATRALVARLQRAAQEGENPPLLILTDQEGGEVKRLSWAPPALAPAAMSSTAIARAEGTATARALREVGVNVDLAPVADVERVAGSFLGSRSFGSVPAVVGARACAFAQGLARGGLAFTLKHFPGLGRALASTDVQSTVIGASRAQLRQDYQAYERCGRARGAIVMVGSAIYPSLTGQAVPAVVSREIYGEELPLAVRGPSPLTISDDLQAPALAGVPGVAVRAVNAGLDLLLYATSESGSIEAHRALMRAARSHILSRDRVRAASTAIATIKRAVAGESPAAGALHFVLEGRSSR